ncbi:MAG: hypothetical protein IKS35_07540 [Clostridia bacterium]|nr:hypothetical protein [Clostridia bacterium]
MHYRTSCFIGLICLLFLFAFFCVQSTAVARPILDENEPVECPDYIEPYELNNRGVVVRLNEHERSFNEVLYENSEGVITSFLFDQPVKYLGFDGTVRDKSLFIASLDDITDESAVGKMDSEYASVVLSDSIEWFAESFDGLISFEKYRYAMLDNDIKAFFPESSFDGVLLSKDAYGIWMIPCGSDSSVNLLNEYDVFDNKEEQQVVYDGVFGEQTSLTYSTQLNGLKETIIIRSNPNCSSFSYTIIGDGVSLRINNQQIVDIVDVKTGDSVGEIGEIVCLDSSGRISKGTISLETIDFNTFHLTIEIDSTFLESATYPVYVDPTILYKGVGHYDYIQDFGIYSSSDAWGYTFEEMPGLGCQPSYSPYIFNCQWAVRFPVFYTANNDYDLIPSISSLGPENIFSFKFHVKSYGSGTHNITANTYAGPWMSYRVCDSAYYDYYDNSSIHITKSNIVAGSTFEYDLTEAAQQWAAYQRGYTSNYYCDPQRGLLFRSDNNTSFIYFERPSAYGNTYAVIDYTPQVYDNIYLNNLSTKKFLGCNGNGSVLQISGSSTSIGNAISWKMEYAGNGQYYIRSNYDSAKYINYLGQFTTTAYPWVLTYSSPGKYSIKQPGTSNYLGPDGTAGITVSSSLTGTQRLWRLCNATYYHDHELTSLEVADVILDEIENMPLSFTFNQNACFFLDKSEFAFDISPSNPVASISPTTHIVSGLSQGVLNITVTHIPTNLFDTFQIIVCKPISENTYFSSLYLDCGESYWYSFVPKQNDEMVFYSSRTTDTVATCYANNLQNLIATSDDDGEGLNFKLYVDVQVGSKYFYRICGWNTSTQGIFALNHDSVFWEKLYELDSIACAYAVNNYSHPQRLSLDLIRHREYDDFKFDLACGPIDTAFVNYISTNYEDLYNYFYYTVSGDSYSAFFSDNSYIDIDHLCATFLVLHSISLWNDYVDELAGWGGDLRSSVPFIMRDCSYSNDFDTVYETTMNYIGNPQGYFPLEDLYADLDARNLMNSSYCNASVYTLFHNYYFSTDYLNRFSLFTSNYTYAQFEQLAEQLISSDLSVQTFPIFCFKLYEVDSDGTNTNVELVLNSTQKSAIATAFADYIWSFVS